MELDLALRNVGWEVTRHPTERARHATDLARELADRDRIVVVGGDGTLRETAAGLPPGTGPPLGFVPMGNANVIARELGIVRGESAIRTAVLGRSIRLDALRANGEMALAMVGVGYDGAVTEMLDRARQRGFTGSWYRWHADSLYGAIGALALFARAPQLRLSIEDGAEVPCRGLVASNVETYAKGWAITPGADPTDGLFDYQVRKRGSAGADLRALWSAFRRRRLTQAHADYGRTVRLRLRSDEPFPWQADGDSMGRCRELSIELLPGALRVIAPATGAPTRPSRD